MSVSCVITSIGEDRIKLRTVSETTSANQRLSFRVNTVCSNIKAQIGASSKCQIMDVSAAGIRVNTPEQLMVGDTVSVRFRAFGEEIKGQFTVRRVSSANGGTQAGLSADPNDKEMINTLTQMASAAQREQLRRRSGIVSGEPIANAMQGADGDGSDASMEEGGVDAWIHIPASTMADRELPGPLVSAEGKEVASRGEVLSLEQFKILGKDGLFATESWSEEKIDRREKPRPSRPNSPEDRRATDRSRCKCQVWVSALQGKHIARMRADLIDISRGGVGLRAPTLLMPQTCLVIEFSTSEEDTCWIIGKVTNGVVGDGETTCRVGVQFHLDSVQRGRVPSCESDFSKWVSVKPMQGARERADRK